MTINNSYLSNGVWHVFAAIDSYLYTKSCAKDTVKLISKQEEYGKFEMPIGALVQTESHYVLLGKEKIEEVSRTASKEELVKFFSFDHIPYTVYDQQGWESLKNIARNVFEWSFNDKKLPIAGRHHIIVIASDGDVGMITFEKTKFGKIISSDYHKNGKWSYSTYRCLSPNGVRVFEWNGSFPSDTLDEAFEKVQYTASDVSREKFEAFMEEKFSEDFNRMKDAEW